MFHECLRSLSPVVSISIGKIFMLCSDYARRSKNSTIPTKFWNNFDLISAVPKYDDPPLNNSLQNSGGLHNLMLNGFVTALSRRVLTCPCGKLVSSFSGPLCLLIGTCWSNEFFLLSVEWLWSSPLPGPDRFNPSDHHSHHLDEPSLNCHLGPLLYAFCGSFTPRIPTMAPSLSENNSREWSLRSPSRYCIFLMLAAFYVDRSIVGVVRAGPNFITFWS